MNGEKDLAWFWGEFLRLEAEVGRVMPQAMERHHLCDKCKPEVRKAKPQKDVEEVPEETRRKCAAALLDLAVRINRDGAALTKYASALAIGKITKHRHTLPQLRRYTSGGQAHGDKVIDIMAPMYAKEYRGTVKASKDMREALDQIVHSQRPAN